MDKYITIETKDETSIKNFINELKMLKIDEQLSSDNNAQVNYDLFSSLITFAKEKHLPKNVLSIKKTQEIKVDNKCYIKFYKYQK